MPDAPVYRINPLTGKHERYIHPGEGGTGDVVGPASSGDNVVARFDGTTGKILQTSGWVIDNNNDGSNVKSIKFNNAGSSATGAGTISWNPADYTFNIDTGLGPVGQALQEQYVVVWNGTGAQLDKGIVVYPVGQVSGRPSIDKAKADTHEKIERPIYVTTMDIPNSSFGICTRFGFVRGIDTSGFTLGSEVYVSATTDGALTSTKPEFPNYSIRVGGTIKTGVSDGEIFVDVAGAVQDTFMNFWNGVFREAFDFLVTESAGVVTGNLTPTNGHDDMTMIFSDGFTMLTTTPAATITLTPGTDAVPQTNFVYIPKSTKVLTVSTSDWPVTEHIKVATVVLRTAATTATDGALRNQNWNDHIEDTTTFQGHLSHMTERMRQMPAHWQSGVEASVSIVSASDPDDVYVSVTGGKVYQLRRQTFPALDMATGDDMHIVNDSVNPYDTVTNLNTQTLDSTGATLVNRHFSFVIWGIQNKSGETSHMMLNLPGDSYTSSSDAIADANSYSNYSIPSQFAGVGFLIARLTFNLSASASGTWTLNDTQDLRGFVPNTTAGGAGGAEHTHNTSTLSSNILYSELSADQNVTGTTGTWYTLAFDTDADSDTGFSIDTVTNVGRFTVPAGRVKIDTNFTMKDQGGGGAGIYQVKIIKDPGGTPVDVKTVFVDITASSSHNVTIPLWAIETNVSSTEYEIQFGRLTGTTGQIRINALGAVLSANHI